MFASAATPAGDARGRPLRSIEPVPLQRIGLRSDRPATGGCCVEVESRQENRCG